LKPTDEKLTPKQEQAIVALLSCDELQKACEQAKVSKTTLWRWLKTPAFQSHYREARRQLVETTFAHIQRNGERASKVLIEIAESKDAPAASRVAAARAILEQGVKGVETLDIAERIEKLEQMVKDNKGKK